MVSFSAEVGVDGVEDPEFDLRDGLGRDCVDRRETSVSSRNGRGRMFGPGVGTYSSARINSPLRGPPSVHDPESYLSYKASSVFALRRRRIV